MFYRIGREVHLSVGTAPRSPRVYRGREVTDWLTDSGYDDIPIASHPATDVSYNNIRTAIDKYIADNAIDTPLEAPYLPPWQPDSEPTELDFVAAGIRTVIWCIGFGTCNNTRKIRPAQ